MRVPNLHQGGKGLLALFAGALIVILTFTLDFACAATGYKDVIPDDYELQPFADTDEGRLAEYGHALVMNTYKLIGPNSNNPISGNKLSCASCHLNGGTKPYAAPYIGLSTVFPTYIAREGRLISLEERINGCFERSLNGRALAVDSQEMRAIVGYIGHLSQHYRGNPRVEGQGFTSFVIPDRAANPASGLKVYQQYCAACHGQDGQGVAVGEDKFFPPLWGSESYNDGAGMARLLTAARYIKGNMPYGTNAHNPVLTDEEAYDVAAYINSHDRPTKLGKEKDYPDLSKKPKDCPYPPYADSISQTQHKLGPFNFTK